jgi:alpha-ribazole phosphatase
MLAHFLYGTAVETDDRLKEISFGSWELKPWAEIPRVESDPWCDDFLESAPPGGESARVLFNRCSELMRYIEARDDGPFALVTHKGCIGAILVYLLGRPLDTILEWSCKPGGVFKIVKEDLRVQVEVVVSGSQ